MLFSVSLAQKLGNKGLISVSLHPGVVNTNISRHARDDSVKALGKWPCRLVFKRRAGVNR